MSIKTVTALAHAHSKSHSGTRTISINTDTILSVRKEIAGQHTVYLTRFSDRPSEYLLEDPRDRNEGLYEMLELFTAFLQIDDKERIPTVAELRTMLVAKAHWEGYYEDKGLDPLESVKKVKLTVLQTWQTFLDEVEQLEIEIIKRTR